MDRATYEKLALENAERWGGNPELDERDAAIVADRMVAIDAMEGPRCGDFVIFADRTVRRISYVWPDGVQTSESGSWYLNGYGCSFSGSLRPTVKNETLTRSPEESIPGRVWIFHHDCAMAHNGVHTSIPFRVYYCSERAS